MAAKVRQRNGAWWVVTHHNGRRNVRRVGPTRAHKREAAALAKKINAALILGTYDAGKKEDESVPFCEFANDWLRREIALPLERGLEGHVSRNTERSYEANLRLFLRPFFGSRDVRGIRVSHVQEFYDHCIESGRPRSRRSIDIAFVTLRRVIAYAVAHELMPANVVDHWKAARGRARGSGIRPIEKERVLTFEELKQFIDAARVYAPDYFPLILFLADTGARIGEAVAIAWSSVDLNRGLARIERGHTIKGGIGPTKTRRERVVELSSRLRTVLGNKRPDIHSDHALVFPNEAGGVIDPTNFRPRVFYRLVRKAFGNDFRRITPHTLRHTFVSLHMARGTNLKWIQAQGGWASAKMLLDVYSHFMPTECAGYADALTAPDSLRRHRTVDGALVPTGAAR